LTKNRRQPVGGGYKVSIIREQKLQVKGEKQRTHGGAVG